MSSFSCLFSIPCVLMTLFHQVFIFEDCFFFIQKIMVSLTDSPNTSHFCQFVPKFKWKCLLSKFKWFLFHDSNCFLAKCVKCSFQKQFWVCYFPLIYCVLLRRFFNCSSTKFIIIIVNVLFFMQIFRLTILRFSSRIISDTSSDCSRFRSSFLSDLYCSYSQVKFVANIKSFKQICRKCLIAQWLVQ